MKSEDNKKDKTEKQKMLGKVPAKGRRSEKTDWKLKDGTIITQKMLAELIGKKDRNLRSEIDKMPEYAKKDVTSFLDYFFTKDIVLTDEEGNKIKLVDLKEQKLFHDTRRSKHDANRARIHESREEFEMDITRGDYILREKVVHRIAEISKKFSTKLFAFPSRVASRLVTATSDEEVKTILKDELKKITEEIDSWSVFM